MSRRNSNARWRLAPNYLMWRVEAMVRSGGKERIPDLKRLLRDLVREMERVANRNEVLERRLSSISGALSGAVRMQGRPAGQSTRNGRRTGRRGAPSEFNDAQATLLRKEYEKGAASAQLARKYKAALPPSSARCAARAPPASGAGPAGSARSRRLVERAAVGRETSDGERTPARPGKQHPVARSAEEVESGAGSEGRRFKDPTVGEGGGSTRQPRSSRSLPRHDS